MIMGLLLACNFLWAVIWISGDLETSIRGDLYYYYSGFSISALKRFLEDDSFDSTLHYRRIFITFPQ